jgi:hypothetical protein
VAKKGGKKNFILDIYDQYKIMHFKFTVRAHDKDGAVKALRNLIPTLVLSHPAGNACVKDIQFQTCPGHIWHGNLKVE